MTVSQLCSLLISQVMSLLLDVALIWVFNAHMFYDVLFLFFCPTSSNLISSSIFSCCSHCCSMSLVYLHLHDSISYSSVISEGTIYSQIYYISTRNLNIHVFFFFEEQIHGLSHCHLFLQLVCVIYFA